MQCTVPRTPFVAVRVPCTVPLEPWGVTTVAERVAGSGPGQSSPLCLADPLEHRVAPVLLLRGAEVGRPGAVLPEGPVTVQLGPFLWPVQAREVEPAVEVRPLGGAPQVGRGEDDAPGPRHAEEGGPHGAESRPGPPSFFRAVQVVQGRAGDGVVEGIVRQPGQVRAVCCAERCAAPGGPVGVGVFNRLRDRVDTQPPGLEVLLGVPQLEAAATPPVKDRLAGPRPQNSEHLAGHLQVVLKR
mmetsp:Transcript_29309/g.52715  ORF Transcript_29309/g.52715 Transcript_29309/m.52715 type:complete len:242 (-) Transcript_29309:213-938(-)